MTNLMVEVLALLILQKEKAGTCQPTFRELLIFDCRLEGGYRLVYRIIHFNILRDA